MELAETSYYLVNLIQIRSPIRQVYAWFNIFAALLMYPLELFTKIL
jgi:hypothetical protein